MLTIAICIFFANGIRVAIFLKSFSLLPSTFLSDNLFAQPVLYYADILTIGAQQVQFYFRYLIERVVSDFRLC